MSTTTKFARVSDKHVQTLKLMIDAGGNNTLDTRDRCDRCGAQAHSSFLLEGNESPLKFCGRHTRLHLDVLLELNLATFWIAESELFSVPELKVPWAGAAKSGDGLTDS